MCQEQIPTEPPAVTIPAVQGTVLRTFCGVAALLWLLPIASPNARAQISDSSSVHAGLLRVDGRDAPWPLPDPLVPHDSLRGVAGRLLDAQHLEGYLEASLDSVRYEAGQDATKRQAVFYVSRGDRYLLEAVHLEGVRSLQVESVLQAFESRAGRPLDPAVLEADLRYLLREYDRVGLVLASARVEEVREARTAGERGLELVVLVEEGRRLELAGFRIPDGSRTRPAFVARTAGLKIGEPLKTYRPREIRRRLMETGLYAEVLPVTLAIDDAGRAVVVVPVREAAPGAFDAVVGYLPPRSEGGRGSVVGNVNILLRNLLGGGRAFAFRFNRLPARVTEIDLSIHEPYVLGWPVGIEAGLQGYQRDSTYTRRRFRLETGYRVAEGLQVVATLSRELTRPGADSLVNIPRSNAWFAGLGFSFARIDRPGNPRRGWRMKLNVERGRKLRSLAGVLQDPTVEARDEALSQQRLRLESRFYAPLLQRHVLAWGLEGNVLVSSVFDESDLFRIGGARSLRGYNEDQYRGNAVARTLIEWRYVLDRSSYVFTFCDLGYVREPPRSRLLAASLRDEAGDVQPRSRWLPGYGFGLQFGSEAGLFSVSLALNPTEGLGAKVHVGLLLGL